MNIYKKLFSCLIISSVFIWTGCEQSTNVEDNTPPPNSQIAKNNTLAKANNSLPQLAPNRFIVLFKDQGNREVSEEKAQQAVQRTQALLSDLSIQQDSVIHQYKYALKGFAAKLTPLQAELLKKDSRVETVVQDIKYKAIQMIGSDNSNVNTMMMSQSTPWGITRVGGTQNGTGKKAWVLDTGIDLNHSDLNVDVSNSVSFVAGESADDGHGHGTHVSGTIAAKNNSSGVVGVAANAQVVAVKVCDSGGYCYTSDLDAGIDYIVSKYGTGDVANISLGWPVSGHQYIDLPLSILESTIETAADDGLKFAIAAGNENQHSNNKSPARIEYNNVWTVSAYDNQDGFASFSNYGNPPIEYSGPGVSVLSLWKNGGTNTINGTSMAAPHVAGLLLMNGTNLFVDGTVSGDPDSSPDEIVTSKLPSPTLQHSVYNNSPKLTWNSISGADEYKLYRKFETGSWVLVTTTSGYSFVDTAIYNTNLQTATSPTYNFEDFYTYKVHAHTNSGSVSDPSNSRYFIYPSCSGPGCGS